MGHVELEQVEAGLGAALRGARRTRRAPRPCRRGSSRAAPGCRRSTASATGPRRASASRRAARPCPPTSASSSPCGRLWPICAPIRAVPWAWTKSTMRLQPSTWSSRYSPPQPGVIRPSARRADHLGHHQRRRRRPPAQPRWTRWKSLDGAVDRGVHVHRRDDDAVGQHADRAAGTAGTSAGCGPSAVGAPARTAAKSSSTRRDEPGIAHAQVVVGDAPAARQQVEGELRAAPGRRSARCPRTTRGSPARRAACSPRPAGARPRRRRARVRTSPSRRGSAHASAIASSIASFVPEPIEKCAVCAASPSSTTFSWCQCSLRTVGKFSQLRVVGDERVAAEDVGEELAAEARCLLVVLARRERMRLGRVEPGAPPRRPRRSRR